MQTPTPSLHESDDIVAERYRIVTLLGQGSMGMTYEAEDLTNYQRVALKVVSLQQMADWKVLELFEREARVLAHLKHPGIPQSIDYFWEDTAKDRRFYLVRELAPGDSLAAWIEKGWRPQERQVRDLARQVLEIFDYLHSLTPPVVHRDIKPENIIRHADGRVFLVDFGSVQDVYRNTLTRGGTFVGTLGYMPPEQFFGQVGAASDLYSLGATLLYVLTGESPADLPQRRMKLEFRDRIDVSTEFADWLEKMLEPAVEDRYRSVREALEVLQNFKNLNGIDRAYPKPIELPTRKHHPPKGTSVTLTRNNDCLTLYFPIYSSNNQWFIPATILSLLLMVYSLASGFLLFLVCFYFYIYQDVNPEPDVFTIDRSNFYIFYASNGKFKKVRGKTECIENFCINLESAINVTVKYPLGENKHEFGKSLRSAEKKWIVDELSDFLRQIRSDKLEITTSA